MEPKFFICTMHCGEPDFPHMVKSFTEQGVEYEHRVFNDMTEIDGHNTTKDLT